MKLKLHEIEIYSKDPDRSRDFYKDKLKLPFHFETGHLKVFSFDNGIDFDISQHNKERLRISFMIDDLDKYIDILKSENVLFEGPYDTHLGLREITIIDPNNNLIAVHQATENSPHFIKDFLK